MMDNEQIGLMLVRIDTNVDNIKASIEKHLGDDEKVHTDHETRLRKAEKVMYGLLGIVALVTVGSGAVAAFG